MNTQRPNSDKLLAALMRGNGKLQLAARVQQLGNAKKVKIRFYHGWEGGADAYFYPASLSYEAAREQDRRLYATQHDIDNGTLADGLFQFTARHNGQLVTVQIYI